MSNQIITTPIDDQYYLLVGGSYNGEHIKLGTNEPEEIIQVPDEVEVGLALNKDYDKGKITHPQIYKYDYNEKHYIFVKSVN